MPCFSSCPRSPTPLNISSCRPLSISSCRLPSVPLGKQQRSDDGGSTRSVGNCDGGSSCGGSDGGCSVLRWRQWLEVAPRGDGRKAARRGLETTVTSRPRGDDGGLTRLGCEQATGRSCLRIQAIAIQHPRPFCAAPQTNRQRLPHEEATMVAPLEEEATVARHGKEVTVGARLRQRLRVRRRQRQRLVGIRQMRRRTGKTADRRLPAATGLMMPIADQLGDKK
uniref:Uncharacterized protein n=1 Tax=Oryza nivara TaxID=4536 RepID=A0A0E0GPD9_ORYNI